MKRALILILTAAVILPSFLGFGALSAKPAITVSAAGGNKSFFGYGVYEAGGYYEINYYLDVHADTADVINILYPAADTGKTGIARFFESIAKFFSEYEKLFFDTAIARFERNTVAAFNAQSNLYYSLHMQIYFENGDLMSAGEKYREYFRLAAGEPGKPTTTGFFADRYETGDYKNFVVLGGMPEYCDFESEDYNFADIQGMASLLDVMMPFLLYGNENNKGFADFPADEFPDKVINYKGLVYEFPKYFKDGGEGGERDTSARVKIFENYNLSQTLTVPTAYIRTNADRHQSFFGEHTHTWNVSYAPNSVYSTNRIMEITYIQPHVINMYFFAVILTFAFIALSAASVYWLPKLKDKKKGNS